MPTFSRFIDIDYSVAKAAVASLTTLRFDFFWTTNIDEALLGFVSQQGEGPHLAAEVIPGRGEGDESLRQRGGPGVPRLRGTD